MTDKIKPHHLERKAILYHPPGNRAHGPEDRNRSLDQLGCESRKIPDAGDLFS
jgi:hypothetical protein